MKLTAQEEYGLRCILSLARAEASERERQKNAGAPPSGARGGATGNGKSLTINDIAEIEGISAQYAGKLIRILGKAKLVQSVRGCKGGYRLSRDAAEINVAEVLNALGSKMYDPSLCERFRGDREFCVHSNDCSVRSLWTGLQLMIDRVLTQTSLAELVEPDGSMDQWLSTHAKKAELVLAENFTDSS